MTDTTYRDRALGELTWDDELEWWGGRTQVGPGHFINVWISASREVLGKALEVTHSFLPGLADDLKFRRAAADQLLDIYNAEWGEGEIIDHATFVSRIKLKDTTVHPDGEVGLCYDDGDLFAGHTIILSMDADGSVSEVAI